MSARLVMYAIVPRRLLALVEKSDFIGSPREDALKLSNSQSKFCFDLDAEENLSQGKTSTGRFTVDAESAGQFYS